MNDLPAFEIAHNAAARRFEARVRGWLCRLDYVRQGGVLALVHTEVPPVLEGRGIAARLVAAALDDARREGLKVRPVCSYVHAYFRRHPEQRDLLA
jgi:predicted GNAT family acetyltransferase